MNDHREKWFRGRTLEKCQKNRRRRRKQNVENEEGRMKAEKKITIETIDEWEVKKRKKEKVLWKVANKRKRERSCVRQLESKIGKKLTPVKRIGKEKMGATTWEKVKRWKGKWVEKGVSRCMKKKKKK